MKTSGEIQFGKRSRQASSTHGLKRLRNTGGSKDGHEGRRGASVVKIAKKGRVTLSPSRESMKANSSQEILWDIKIEKQSKMEKVSRCEQ